MRKLVLIIAAIAFSSSLAAKSFEELEKDLKSSDDNTVILAAQELGKDKNKSGIEPLMNVIKFNKNVVVRIAATAALGNMSSDKPRANTYLRYVIENDKSDEVKYTALLGLLNLAEEDKQHPEAMAALDWVDKNKPNDTYLKDAVKRIRAKLNKK